MWSQIRNSSIIALQVTESNKKGTQCLGIQLGCPITGGCKYRDLVLQARGLMQGWQPCSVKEKCYEIQISENQIV